MTPKQARAMLSQVQGIPDLEIHKMEGVYYLLGGYGSEIRDVERCLHCVRLEDVTPEVLREKVMDIFGLYA